jgi:hypothetical protein
MLSPEQITARKNKLTASRVACLMTADEPKILRLYQEMIGEAEEEDLSDVWPVQLGSATEEVNLRWFERKHNTTVTKRGEFIVHPELTWAGCTLDGWVEES